MSHFSSNYSKISYPIADRNSPGLRNAQIGAIHSIGAHFSLHPDIPALITMPTGSGKTAVLNLSAYLLMAKRVLVISSSVMVRGQIENEFSTLKTLKGSGVFPQKMAFPKVYEVKSPIKSSQEWRELKAFDVVVGIPNSLNEGIKHDFKPENDLFDLVLVDEAHHVPAFTWTNIIEAFPEAKKVFFTATPFRRDKKEVPGKLVFNYPLSKAYEDKIFGDIGYYPIITDDANPDLAIALKTQEVFQQDTAKGLVHFIMVRTETKDHAEELSGLYALHTDLRLKKVDSTQTYGAINKTIDKLKNGELDGIICVDMLGEGFDFPNLKIAAIHSPKKSLANTLQFIGRFARTNAQHIGEAKFLAVPSDIEIGKRKLYAEGAIWNDIIKNLSQEVMDKEDEIKQALDTFEREPTTESSDEISFYNLNPYCHVKIYKVDGVNLETALEMPGQEIIHHAISNELNTVIYITKETERPKWISSDQLINVKHYFFMVYYDEQTHMLFIHSSIKTPQFYDMLVENFVTGEYERISKFQINKVLVDIDNPEFFNIGMQNRSANSGESYRIVAGPNAETTIKKSHGKNYANGHVFMKGSEGGNNVTVGYSSGSKVWSNAYEKIPAYIKWCRSLAEKMVSNKVVKTNTAFDDLPIGKVVANFPLGVHGATWNGDTFSETPFLNMMEEGEITSHYQLLDFDLIIDQNLSDPTQVVLSLSVPGLDISLRYTFQDHFEFHLAPDTDFIVEVNHRHISLLDYLNDNPLQFFLDDFATVSNHEYFAPPNENDFHYDAAKIVAFNWAATNTDIRREFYDNAQAKANNANQNSIHESLESKLLGDGYPVLIYDHGTGEIADFISFNEFNDRIEVNLYHVKGSGGDAPGDRVSDVYEVCMQAVKCQSWTANKHTFRQKVVHRTDGNPRKFLLGDQQQFLNLINSGKRVVFLFSIVQPGISPAALTPKLSYILAAADDSITNNGYDPLIAIGS
jgi:superfamily II DNA or RNA helicase